MHVRIGARTEEVLTALLPGQACRIHPVGEHDCIILFGDSRHGGSDRASRAPAEILDLVLEDQGRGLSGHDVRLQFRIDGDHFNLPPQNPSLLIEDLGRILDTFQVALSDILEGSREGFGHPQFDGFRSPARDRKRGQEDDRLKESGIRKMNFFIDRPSFSFWLNGFLLFYTSKYFFLTSSAWISVSPPPSKTICPLLIM